MPLCWKTNGIVRKGERRNDLRKSPRIGALLIKNKKEKKSWVLDSRHGWNDGDDYLQKIVSVIVEGIDNDLEWLTAIKKQMPPLSRCKHPKELRDKCDGKWYCMECNEDL